MYDLVKGTVWPLTEKVTEEVSMLWYLTKTLQQLFKYAKKKRLRIKENWKQCTNQIRIPVKRVKKKKDRNFGFEKYNY